MCIQGLPSPDFLQFLGALSCILFPAQQPLAISSWAAAPEFALRRRGLQTTESGYRIGWRHDPRSPPALHLERRQVLGVLLKWGWGTI